MPKLVKVGCSSDPSETSVTVDISRTSRANIVQRQTEPRTPSWPNLHEGRSQPSYRYAQLDTRLSMTGAHSEVGFSKGGKICCSTGHF